MMRRVAITGLGLVSPYAPGEGLMISFIGSVLASRRYGIC